jgi:hypothetical protein
MSEAPGSAARAVTPPWSGGRRAAIVAVALAVVVVGGGIGFYFFSRGTDPKSSKVGVAVDAAGSPVLLTVGCPGRTIGAAQVHRPGGSAVWSAQRTGGRGAAGIAMSGPVAGYEVTGDVAAAAADERLELGSVRDDRGVSVGTAQIVFRRADLKADQILVGVRSRDGSPLYESSSAFRAPVRC